MITAILAIIATTSTPAHALEKILHPYQSVRAAGMGNVKITTGLYDENFFGNPARVTANPKFRATIFDPALEFNANAIDTMSSLTGGGDPLQKIADTAGSNNHGRLQTTLPSLYFPVKEDGKMAFAFGLISSTQFDIDLRRNFELNPQGLTDIGPALTVGRRFMEEDKLSVGLTAHAIYRLSSKPGFSFVDLLKGTSLSPAQSGGEGAMIDFDLGGTYALPFKLWDFNFTAGAAINNLLGGNYSNLGISIANLGTKPIAQPRSLGFGIAGQRPELGKFTNTTVALEFYDIGNNTDGSIFKTVHVGGETHYGVLAPRLGINQGYLTVGIGLDLRFFTIDYAYYGEEASLNPGGLEDRIHAIKLALQI